jgi:hypothetical protein
LKRGEPPKRKTPLRRKKPEPRRKESIILAFPKPGQIKRDKPAVKVMKDGREVCDLLTKQGRDEYVRRVDVMFVRQDKRCGLMISHECMDRSGKWPRNMICFGHPFSRGFSGGKRDDRIEIDGKPTMARALCPFCNTMQASRPITDFLDAI